MRLLPIALVAVAFFGFDGRALAAASELANPTRYDARNSNAAEGIEQERAGWPTIGGLEVWR